MVSKKKKKRSSPKLSLIFRPTSHIQTLSHTESRLRHSISFGGVCFQFFTKNQPKKQQKRTILHTSQANGGGGARGPPAPLATLLVTPSAIFLPKKPDASVWQEVFQENSV